MNPKTAIFIVNPDVRAMRVLYENDQSPKIVKTLNKDIKVDDLVIIQTGTRFGFTAVKVVETDIVINMNGTADMAWVHQIVDKKIYDNLAEQEAKIIGVVASADMRRQRQEMAKDLVADGLKPEDFAGLSIVTASALTALPAPAPKA